MEVQQFGMLPPCLPIKELINVITLMLRGVTNVFIAFTFAYPPGERQGSISKQE